MAAVPTSTDLKARYPAFTAVDEAVISYWITDAQRFVDASWSDTDFGPAILSLAAHNMALAGLGADAAALAGVPAGITSMKSGSLSLNFSEAAANARLTGDLTSTRYGQEFQLLRLKNRGGPIVADTGFVPCPDYPPFERGW